jgi:hypothetical protein
MRSLSRTSVSLDAHILERQARQLGDVAVVLRIEAGLHDVDQLDRALLPRPRLEQLLLASAHRAVTQLLLHDLQPLGDLGSSVLAQYRPSRNSTT